MNLSGDGLAFPGELLIVDVENSAEIILAGQPYRRISYPPMKI